MTKILIVGNGIAGAVLAAKLLDSGIAVSVYDEYIGNSSSRVAAGLFNPIAGKRLSLTWEALNSWESLYAFYPKWEKILGKQFFYEKPVFRILQGQDQLNDWSARSKEWPYSWFLDEIPLQQTRLGETQYWGLLIRKSGWLDTKVFLDSMYAYLEKQGVFWNRYLSPEELVFLEDGSVKCGAEEFSHVIHCGGWRAGDPWLQNKVPFTPMRGEIIDVAHDHFPEEYMVVKNHFLLPLGSGVFRIGSTYDWRITEAVTTEEGLETLMQFAQELMGGTPRLLAHRAGVRPAVKDRRPMIGKLGAEKNLYLFNGFGSKAVSLAPWLAEKFIAHLLKGDLLPAGADVKRFL